MRNKFIDTVIDSIKEEDSTFIITGDAGLGVFDSFKDEHPDRYLNLGVAEQNMISFAAGMALTGQNVFIYNIIPFLLYRCYEQVRNDICYQELPVKLIGIGSGVTYSPQGMTHYSVEDLAIAETLPNLTVFSPIDPLEAQMAAEYSLGSSEPVYVRLAKRGEPVLHKGSIDITRPIVMKKGADIAIVFHGSIGIEAVTAVEKLSAEGIDVTLVSLPMVQPFPGADLLDILAGHRHVITLEEHFSKGGIGSKTAYVKASADTGWSLHMMGIEHKFIHAIKDNSGMRKLFGIDADAVINKVKGLLK